MQRQKIEVALALFMAASLVLMPVASSAAHGMDQASGQWNGGSMAKIDAVYHAVTVRGMTGDSLTFDIVSTAVKSNGNVTSMRYATPISVQYFYANDTAIATLKNVTGNRTGGKPAFSRANYSDATLNVSGASAVVVVKGTQMFRQGGNVSGFQISGFSVYLSNGTVKSYALSMPVKITRSKANRTMTIVGNPQFRADLQDAFRGITGFPANVTSVKIKDIDAAVK